MTGTGATGAGGAPSSGGQGAGGRMSNGGSGGIDSGADGAMAASDAGGDAGSACNSGSTNYDQLVLCDRPVGFWAMSMSSGTQETDLSGNGSTGTYEGPAPSSVAMPNGDQAADFNGSSNYLTVPSKAAFSIPATGELTWEAWIRPSTLQFPNDSGGYVDWMGKCASYAPTCEWEARMYSTDNSQNRCNRLSAYVFNSGAGLGSGADWQPTCGLFQADTWFHVVGEYTTKSQPSDCSNADSYPGSINIWVNGVEWDHASHGDTGCFSQYNVVPEANDSPINIGTMAKDAWFQGAVGKVAIYDFLLSQTQITNHYRAMTGKSPTGSCQDTCTFQK
jgi:concanavalin A-like lectin/glucanase superfamily protein